jgi:hydroxylamine reductase (hybrid-cluster protein)
VLTVRGWEIAEIMNHADAFPLNELPRTDSKELVRTLCIDSFLQVGALNGKVMQTLDQAHADNFGAPEPTEIRTTAVKGKCILVSGHDLKELYELLNQTEGTGVNVYTHGEMQPAHTYPKLKAFSHLVSNYGTAWQNPKILICRLSWSHCCYVELYYGTPSNVQEPNLHNE